MLSVLFTAVVMFIAIKLMHKDGDVIDFGLVIMLAIAPMLVLWLSSAVAAGFGLNELASLIGLLMALVTVFVFSKNAFEWSKKRALGLSSVYLLALVAAESVVVTVSG